MRCMNLRFTYLLTCGNCFWIGNWSYIATHLVVLVGASRATSSNKTQGSVVSNRIGMKFVLQIGLNTRRLTESCSIYAFKLTVMTSARRLLIHMQQRPPAAC